MNAQCCNAPKRSLKRLAAILPLAALAMVTLFGNTYRFHTLPKVQAVGLTNGAFPIMISLNKIRLSSDELIPIVLPDVLDGKLSAAAVLVDPSEMVKKGQTILTYKKQKVDRLLANSAIAVIAAQEALYQFDIGFADACVQATKAVEQAAKALERAQNQKNNKKIPELQKSLDKRQHELDLLSKSGYFAETTRAALLWQLDAAVQLKRELELIAKNNYALTAPEDGYLMQNTAMKADSELPAGVALYRLLPIDANYHIELPVPDDLHIQLPSLNTKLTLYREGNRNDTLTVTFAGEHKKNLILVPNWEDLSNLAYIEAYMLQLSSPFYPFLAPKEVFDKDGMIYLLKPTSQEQIYTVSKLKAETEATGNGDYLPLRGAFPADALLILYPEPKIPSGSRVFLLPN